MTRPSQSDLYAQRPVRSDFGRRQQQQYDFGGINWARLLLLIGGVGVALAGGYALSTLGSSSGSQDGIPHITAEGPIKEKPQNPGGIDIPHQDVQVFHELDTKNQTAQGSGKIEHLLPGPDTPQPVATEAPKPSAAPAKSEVISSVAPTKIEEIAPLPTESQIVHAAIPDAAGPKEVAPADFDDKPVAATKVEAKPAPIAETPKPTLAPKAKETKVVAPAKAKAEPVAENTEPARLPAELFTSDNPEAIKSAHTATAPASKALAAPAGNKVRLQLASLPDREAAQSTMQRLQSQYGGVLGGSTLSIVKADVAGKGTYYRVMSAPMAEMQAKSICADLSKKKAACLVAR